MPSKRSAQSALPIEITKMGEDDNVVDCSSLPEFMKTGLFKHCFEGYPVLDSYLLEVFLIIVGKRVIGFDPYFDTAIPDENDVETCAVIDAEFGIILNGDGDANDCVLDGMEGYPTVSFNCVGRLLHPEGKKEPKIWSKMVSDLLLNGDLKIVAFVPDKTIPLNKEEKRKVKAGKKVFRRGFSVVNGNWHQAATVVLRHKTTEGDLLVGQDEGTYFGVLLNRQVNTVDEAYAALMPQELASRRNILRQGEWFIVPVKEKEVPKVKDCLTEFQQLVLPRESEESNEHVVEACHGENGRISKNGKIFVRGLELSHSDHEAVSRGYKDGWHTFYRNTAIRSVSEQGVD
jgi:hypothetical protein